MTAPKESRRAERGDRSNDLEGCSYGTVAVRQAVACRLHGELGKVRRKGCWAAPAFSLALRLTDRV